MARVALNRVNPGPASPAPRTEFTRGLSLIGSTGRIPALDGLRGIAILLVLLWHVVFGLHPDSKLLTNLLAVGKLSWSGVDLFFVLSGFLIGGILLDRKIPSATSKRSIFGAPSESCPCTG
jgi:uncharacterized membrane protein YcfT